ncbi:UbiA family prenyltransferase [Halodesulfurarchaeum sp. HSR-GB]|uniref:UbiA family prenyltransferase n=1 Tax=Halodesulfurarchaeum sp. HSR-GB TaxID=3074077 RepID=UPI002866BDF9|nr:UbiA family prenyltransferase [Halodesulfurarchaeum sp. HSR-GB]MDR5657026.1 UbiA family prenyltransferase [Halodesulfurarchaeum sp. HSR-GB]
MKDLFVYTQLDIVGMGVAGVLTVMFVMSLPLSPAPLVIGLVTFGVYVGDRISDIKREPNATSDRSAFMRRHKSVLSVSSALAYGLAIAISVFGGPLALAITLVPGIFWILYASDWLDSVGTSVKRLKNILFVNSSVVAFAWATAVVFLPVSFANASITPTVIVLFAYFFFDIYINAEVPNFRDIEDDAANGVSTLPIVFGTRRTRHILYSINIFLVAIISIAYVHEWLPLVVVGAIIVGRLYGIILNGFLGRVENYRQLELLGEMKHVIVGLLLLVVVLS